MILIQYIINAIELLLFIYLGFASLYYFILGLIGLFKFPQRETEESILRKYAVFIPGYKEDQVIIEVAKEALNQSYPKELYDVVVIADSFKPETLEELRKIDITLMEVSFEKSSKAKALNKAMETLDNRYDVALILDADNIMEKDFIKKINHAFDTGYKVVQGHRVAKNLNTTFAVLDAVSEEICNHLFRKAHRMIGLSAGLIGSGMAFEYQLFKGIMSDIDAIGGFDKELELKLLRSKIQIEYVEDALVYDEKVQNTKVFVQQRRRWLSAQFIYFKKFFFSGLYHLFFKGNIDFFNKVYHMMQPPRILLLGFVTTITLIFFILEILHVSLEGWILLGFRGWLLALVLTYLALMFSTPRKFYNKKTLSAILSLPKGFILMALSLLTIKGANEKFIHTEHGISNNLKAKS